MLGVGCVWGVWEGVGGVCGCVGCGGGWFQVTVKMFHFFPANRALRAIHKRSRIGSSIEN